MCAPPRARLLQHSSAVALNHNAFDTATSYPPHNINNNNNAATAADCLPLVYPCTSAAAAAADCMPLVYPCMSAAAAAADQLETATWSVRAPSRLDLFIQHLATKANELYVALGPHEVNARP